MRPHPLLPFRLTGSRPHLHVFIMHISCTPIIAHAPHLYFVHINVCCNYSNTPDKPLLPFAGSIKFNPLDQFRVKKRITLREAQSLVGVLNFACKVIRPGRAFLRRLIDLTMGANRKHHYVKLSTSARADITAWLGFLENFNGVSIFLHNQFTSSQSIKLYSDASGSIGFAAVLGSRWFAGKWDESWHAVHITPKELFPIVLAIEIWGRLLANHKILFRTDNAAVVEIINKQTSRDPHAMTLVRRLVLASLHHNVLFRAEHIPGVTNVIADHLSRFRLQEAQRLAPWLNQAPCPVPLHLTSLRCKSQLHLC